MIAVTSSGLSVAAMIGAVIVTATAGDILTASAMRKLGDLDVIRAERGLSGAIMAVLTNLRFFSGVFFLACSFFSLLFALSHAHLSLVGPASASLTFVTNAIAAKIFLKENVDHRRWAAAILVCVGVILMSR